VNIILTELSGNILDKLGCKSCGAEFVMLKRSQKVLQDTKLSDKTPIHCPDCGGSLGMFVKTPLGSTLKNVIITGQPILKKQEATSKDQENPAGPEAVE
jgi:DNA-directed RNA polymerase subunit RPC12/RpoP